MFLLKQFCAMCKKHVRTYLEIQMFSQVKGICFALDDGPAQHQRHDAAETVED
jgi:hypothetical protein